MSDNYHRPTLTFPDRAYNATQVRLYGITPNGDALLFPDDKISVESEEFEIRVNSLFSDPSNNENVQSQINQLTQNGKFSNGQIANMISNSTMEFPTGFGYATQLSLRLRKFGMVVISTVVSLNEIIDQEAALSCGIIVGYSYEGHCYDLPKPKIMLIPAAPQPIPIDDCGFDKKVDPNFPDSPENYRLWIVDKLDECVEFEMNQGFVEQLVLEANLPGKRSPSMYASRMMMGHRSGRLGE